MQHTQGEDKRIQNISRIFKEKRALGKLRSRWEENNKMGFIKNSVRIVNWTHMAEDSFQCRDFMDAAMNVQVKRKARNFLTK
jgi:hypothetical protein